ncbi:MAG: UDP-N-acetylmuramate dehydrogenase [Burkholderiales bacterium]
MAEPGLRGRLIHGEAMSKHTTWRVGGAADRVYLPADLRDFANFLRTIPPEEIVRTVGLGSNLLVRDGGIRGTVIFTHGALKQTRTGEPTSTPFAFPASPFTVYAEAGVASPIVARIAARHSLSGGEFLAGIPGTIGGALRMNAGCWGAETWDIVERVLVVDRNGNLKQRTKDDYDIGYRSVALKSRKSPSPHSSLPSTSLGTRLTPHEFFAATWFTFGPGDRSVSLQKIRDLLSRRIASQPLSIPNAGSVFRNPPGDHAARLIETCGLKGAQIGGAAVSVKHANFIVNNGNASAADIEALIEKAHEGVLRKTGIDLVREVEIIGDAK